MNLPPHLLNLQANLNNLLKANPHSSDKSNQAQITTEIKILDTKPQSKQKEKKKSKKSKVDPENKSKIKIKNPRFSKKRWKVLRKSAGEVWEDPTLEEWPENDYRVFCGDLGNEVSDDILANAFRKYSSFLKARVIRDKRTGKSKGYGFISFGEANDYIKVMREMNGKYVGNRPIRLQRSTWRDRSLFNSKSKIENVKFKKSNAKIKTKDLMNTNVNANISANMKIYDGSNVPYNYQNYTVSNNLNMMNIHQYNTQDVNINMLNYDYGKMQSYQVYAQQPGQNLNMNLNNNR